MATKKNARGHTKKETKQPGSKNGKKAEGSSGTSFFTWFMVLALLGVWTSVAVVWFELVDYDNVLARAKEFRSNISEVLQGKLVAYDTDGDGDFDVEDAKILLGLTKDGSKENSDSLEEVLDILAEEGSDWFYGFLTFLYDVITPFEKVEDEEGEAAEEVAEGAPVEAPAALTAKSKDEKPVEVAAKTDERKGLAEKPAVATKSEDSSDASEPVMTHSVPEPEGDFKSEAVEEAEVVWSETQEATESYSEPFEGEPELLKEDEQQEEELEQDLVEEEEHEPAAVKEEEEEELALEEEIQEEVFEETREQPVEERDEAADLAMEVDTEPQETVSAEEEYQDAEAEDTEPAEAAEPDHTAYMEPLSDGDLPEEQDTDVQDIVEVSEDNHDVHGSHSMDVESEIQAAVPLPDVEEDDVNTADHVGGDTGTHPYEDNVEDIIDTTGELVQDAQLGETAGASEDGSESLYAEQMEEAEPEAESHSEREDLAVEEPQEELTAEDPTMEEDLAPVGSTADEPVSAEGQHEAAAADT